MSKVKFLAYGTLRQGSYNFDRFKRVFGDDFNHVETKTLKGFGMVSLGSYPGGYILPDEECVVDVIECSKEAFNYVRNMETGAGYTQTVVELEGTSYSIFVYKSATAGNYIKDWLEYEKNN